MQYSRDSIFKKGFFYFLTFFLIVLFYLFLDLIISNTILKSVQCYDYTSYKKGHIYFLKKNCQTRQRFRSSFPSTNIFPLVGSKSPRIKSTSELFPEPLSPIIPIVEPHLIFKFIFFKEALSEFL